jgi:hypothetical protein
MHFKYIFIIGAFAPMSQNTVSIIICYLESILNAITQPNYPEQLMVLEVGMDIILMRNLNQEMSLCNGMRLLITRLADCVLKVTDMTSSSSGLNKYTGIKNTKRGDCK